MDQIQTCHTSKKSILMNTKLFTSIVCCLMFNFGFSQTTFKKAIDIGAKDRGTYISQTADEGFIIAGNTNTSSGNYDIALVRTDMYGDTIWTKVYGGEYDEDAYFVKETFDSGFIVAAKSNSFGGVNGKAWIIKTDAAGDTLWARVFNSTIHHVLQTTDSCFFLVGRDSTYWNAVIMKLDQSGELKWSKSYGFSKCFYEVVEISGDQIMVGGLSKMSEPPFSTTIDLFWTNPEGDSLSVIQYEGDIIDYLCLRRTFDNGFILSASTEIIYGKRDMYLHKIDSLGNTQWIQLFGDEYTYDYAYSVVQASDFGYVVTGKKEGMGLVLLKTDQYGDLLWEKSYGNQSYVTKGYCIKNTADGHFVVVGEEAKSQYSSESDMLIMKTDEDGVITNVSESRKENTLMISPNPNHGNFYVQITEGDRELTIFDLHGKTVLKQKITMNNGPSLLIDNLKRGNYLIRIRSDKTSRTAKVVVF
jgi:hypothetical protein